MTGIAERNRKLRNKCTRIIKKYIYIEEEQEKWLQEKINS